MRYLLAWNHSYPILYQSGGTTFQPVDQTRLLANLPIASSLANASVSSNVTFDFLVAPLPQSGSARLVFTSNRDGNAQIYSMNIDGSGLTRLTSNAYNDDHPRWSPNGTRILFQSDRDSTPPDPEDPGPAKQDI